MVRILVRRSQAKIPMTRPNEPDMPPKRTTKVRSGIYLIKIQPRVHDTGAININIAGCQDSRRSF